MLWCHKARSYSLSWSQTSYPTSTISTIKLCGVTALFGIFLQTNKHQNLLRLRCPRALRLMWPSECTARPVFYSCPVTCKFAPSLPLPNQYCYICTRVNDNNKCLGVNLHCQHPSLIMLAGSWWLFQMNSSPKGFSAIENLWHPIGLLVCLMTDLLDFSILLQLLLVN